ncbi:MAG: hypothetical protein JWN65_3403 [Solirubrobacterales bacterium]|jgi:hypothetical protein|nr:hypothetical protein [Solirubrobacterales bacterium]
MSQPAAIDPALQRMLAGELARSLWATARPQGDPEEGAPSSSAADTFATLFTDVLADAIAGTDSAPDRRAAR